MLKCIFSVWCYIRICSTRQTSDRYQTTETPHKSPPASTVSSLQSRVTWGRGQQAQPPPAVLQQVDFPGQDVDLSHLLLSLSKEKTGTLLSQGITALPVGSSHVEAARLQMVPWGQQCRWSSQHMAYREEKHTRSWLICILNLLFSNWKILIQNIMSVCAGKLSSSSTLTSINGQWTWNTRLH